MVKKRSLCQAQCKNLQRNKPDNPYKAGEVRRDFCRRQCSAELGKMSRRRVLRILNKGSLSRARAEWKQRGKIKKQVGILGWGSMNGDGEQMGD